MDARKEIKYAYSLIKRTFSISFSMPKLYHGDEHLLEAEHVDSMKDYVRTTYIVGAYDPERKAMYVPDNNENMTAEERICIFLHELGHAFVDEKSPKLNQKSIEHLLKCSRHNAQAYVYSVVHEAIADHISIECCKKSGNKVLEQNGIERANSLKKSLEEWVAGTDFKRMASIYADEVFDTDKAVKRYLDPSFKVDWQKTLLRYYSRNAEFLMVSDPYVIGHFFMSRLGNPDLNKLITSPPKTIENLLYPETYKI